MSPQKFTAKEEKKEKKAKQLVIGVVFTSIRQSERTLWHDCHIPKETTNVTNEEHTLPRQPSPKEVALTLLVTNGRTR